MEDSSSRFPISTTTTGGGDARAHEEILEFISENEGTTEYKIAREMSKKHVCARGTTHTIIYEILLPRKEIIDKKIGNSFHEFYINNKHPYFVTKEKIINLIKYANEVPYSEIPRQQQKEILRNSVLYLTHLLFYNGVTRIFTRIINVKLEPERDILLRLLGEALWTSIKSTNFMKSVNELEHELQELRTNNTNTDKQIKDVVRLYETYLT